MIVPNEQDTKRAAALITMIGEHPEQVEKHLNAFAAFHGNELDEAFGMIVSLAAFALVSTEILVSNPDSGLTVKKFLDQVAHMCYTVPGEQTN